MNPSINLNLKSPIRKYLKPKLKCTSTQSFINKSKFELSPIRNFKFLNPNPFPNSKILKTYVIQIRSNAEISQISKS